MIFLIGKLRLLLDLQKRPTGEQEEMKRKFKVFFDTIGAYQVQCAQSFVLGQELTILSRLSAHSREFLQIFRQQGRSN